MTDDASPAAQHTYFILAMNTYLYLDGITGRGIIHEEYHSNKFSMGYAGDKLEMCQLWV